MEQATVDLSGLAQETISMQLINGQLYASGMQVTGGKSIPVQLKLEAGQHNYSIPLEQVVIETSPASCELMISNPRSLTQNQADDESDTDFNDKIMAGSSMGQRSELPDTDDGVSPDLIPDRLSQSISHHDYLGTVPVIQKPSMMGSNQTVSVPLEDHENGLVIEEVGEEEISTTDALDDEEEIVRSKPLTAMYLQSKDIHIPNHRDYRIPTPTKSPSSSKFLLKPSTRTFDDYDDLNEDIYRMRNAYNDPVTSVYHPNTGEIHFKMEPMFESEKPSPAKRSVEAILAASETIKNQDIASEVEIGTYEPEVSPFSKRGRKIKQKKGGIDDDIEQIRKAAKNVAYTLKGMNSKKDKRKRKKPRIRLTLTKSKGRQVAATTSLTDDDTEYESTRIDSPRKRGRKRKCEPEDSNIIYQCEYCEKQFKTREKVRIHTKIHTEERAFTCDICNSRYRRREHLIRHYRRHTNDRPYQCLECGKAYMRAEHLKRHSYDHTGEKPFECSMCPKAFTRHDRLIKHSLVHDK